MGQRVGGGHLLISDIPANVVQRWTPDGKMSPFLEKPDWTRTTGRPANPRFGANGITLDPQGRVVYAAEADRAIVRLEKDGKRTILAEAYEGKRLNSPNDLVFRSDGALYFTDPSGGNRFADWDLKKELPYQGVFLLKDGKLQLLIKDLDRPNGIALSPDEKFLYVNDSAKRTITRYEVQRDGSVANGKLFADMSTGTGTGNPDGMKFDASGNLYSVGPGGIWVFSPTASIWARSSLPNSRPASRSVILTGNRSTWRRAPGSRAFASTLLERDSRSYAKPISPARPISASAFSVRKEIRLVALLPRCSLILAADIPIGTAAL